MKKLYTILILFFVSNFVFGQNPLVKQWDYRFGGTASDWLYSLQLTKDGGYILGGYTQSGIGGDKTQPLWGYFDYWIVKIDSLGAKQWDKDFGGTDADYVSSMQQTSDGGYILGGFSNSGIGGDKTQANWDSSGYTRDYWIVKTDSLGIKQWDKRFGGNHDDELTGIRQTTDGGYILGGFSRSGISGDKTQLQRGKYDYWMVKIDSSATKEWDKRFGGSQDDYAYSILQTNDGGYLIGGFSLSDSSFDKTQHSRGGSDQWIVKTNSLGIKQWDKRFGGSAYDYLYSMEQTSDGGYILAGLSFSNISGDKTQNTWGNIDYWIVKIDAAGNKEWDKDYGGSNVQDELGSVIQTADHGYLLSGSSYSDISGDKTEDNLGSEQAWIVKTDSVGNKTWDKTLFTNGHDEFSYAFSIQDGCYIVATGTNSGIAGYVTQPTQGYIDYWIIKLCDTTSTTGISNFQITNYNFQISPNPFTSDISITFQIENPPGRKQYIYKASFTIKNVLGQTVFENPKFQIPNSNYQTNLDLSFLPNGIYLLEVFIDGDRMVKKIVKE